VFNHNLVTSHPFVALAKQLTLAELNSKQLDGNPVVVRVDFNVPSVKDGPRPRSQLLKPSSIMVRTTLFFSLTPGARMGSVRRRSASALLPGVFSGCSTVRSFSFRIQSALKAPGSVVLLESVRFHVESEGSAVGRDGKRIKAAPEAIEAYSKALSSDGDVYISDAFGTAHVSMAGGSLPIRAAGHLIKTDSMHLPRSPSPRCCRSSAARICEKRSSSSQTRSRK
jgi:phosphoglycerate kinase